MVRPILALATIALLCATHADAQFGMPKKKKYKAVRSDLPYIKCAVCKRLVKHLARHVDGMSLIIHNNESAARSTATA